MAERVAIVDVDDLFCEEQITKWLVPLHDKVPDLVVTAYTIPNRFGPVHEVKKAYPWIRFAIHGWEHTFAECRAWTADLAKVNLELALKMGYEPVFEPPNWIYDRETETACNDLEVVLHHHLSDFIVTQPWLKCYPGPVKTRAEHEYVHTHIQRNPATDFIGDHPKFTSEYLAGFGRFATPQELAQTL